jgi:co-chaperonin GroES (HSP10)
MSALLKSPITSRMNVNVQQLADRDPKADFGEFVLKALKPHLKEIEVLHSDVLVATYVRPNKTQGGIFLTDKTTDEDRWQCKAGLVLKMGATAFKYEGPFPYEGPVPAVGQYVAFHTSDSREIGFLGYSCRIIASELVRMITSNPEYIY